jgi:hypothetical protein
MTNVFSLESPPDGRKGQGGQKNWAADVANFLIANGCTVLLLHTYKKGNR